MKPKLDIRDCESALIAFGGNALDVRGMKQAANVLISAANLVPLLYAVHGNGPQVQEVLDRGHCELHEAVAKTQREIGCAMRFMLKEYIGIRKESDLVVDVLPTHILVDPKDTAFINPTKPIGRFMSEVDANRLSAEYGWDIRELSDGINGNRYRRVVPSPKPKSILELEEIAWAPTDNDITICAGGGGIPCVLDANGQPQPINAVIDKDAAAALLAIQLRIRKFVILTEADGVYAPEDYKRKQNGDSRAKPIPQMSARELMDLVNSLPPGSMGPKASALASFANQSGRPAYVGALKNGLNFNRSGTVIVP